MKPEERLKQFKHQETYLDIIEDGKLLIINIKYKKSNELQLKIEVGREDEETIEKICGVLKYYEFSEHININSMYDLKNFLGRHCYYLGYRNNEYVFAKNFLNGAIKMFPKHEIENMHKVNINAI